MSKHRLHKQEKSMKAFKEVFYAVIGIGLAAGVLYVGVQLNWW